MDWMDGLSVSAAISSILARIRGLLDSLAPWRSAWVALYPASMAACRALP
jgi:hypothetical protein